MLSISDQFVDLIIMKELVEVVGKCAVNYIFEPKEKQSLKYLKQS